MGYRLGVYVCIIEFLGRTLNSAFSNCFRRTIRGMVCDRLCYVDSGEHYWCFQNSASVSTRASRKSNSNSANPDSNRADFRIFWYFCHVITPALFPSLYDHSGNSNNREFVPPWTAPSSIGGNKVVEFLKFWRN